MTVSFRKEGVWAHKTSLTRPLLIVVPVPRHGSERPIMNSCVRGIDLAFFYHSCIGCWFYSDSVVFLFIILYDVVESV